MTSTHFRSRAHHFARSSIPVRAISTSPVRAINRPHLRDIHASQTEVLLLFLALLAILILLAYIFYTLLTHFISRCSPSKRASEGVDRTARFERGVGRGARNLAMGFFDGIKNGNREETEREGSEGKGFFGKLFSEGDERSGEGRGMLAGSFEKRDREERRGLLGHGHGYGGWMGGDRERIGEWGYGGGFMDGSECSGRSTVHRDDCVGECGDSFDRRRSANY